MASLANLKYPPGALVYVDNYEIGTTPVSTDYIYYGTRRIRLVKDGYATLDIKQWIPPPWYEIIGIDFVSENLVPAEIRDHLRNHRQRIRRVVGGHDATP